MRRVNQLDHTRDLNRSTPSSSTSTYQDPSGTHLPQSQGSERTTSPHHLQQAIVFLHPLVGPNLLVPICFSTPLPVSRGVDPTGGQGTDYHRTRPPTKATTLVQSGAKGQSLRVPKSRSLRHTDRSGIDFVTQRNRKMDLPSNYTAKEMKPDDIPQSSCSQVSCFAVSYCMPLEQERLGITMGPVIFGIFASRRDGEQQIRLVDCAIFSAYTPLTVLD